MVGEVPCCVKEKATCSPSGSPFRMYVSVALAERRFPTSDQAAATVCVRRQRGDGRGERSSVLTDAAVLGAVGRVLQQLGVAQLHVEARLARDPELAPAGLVLPEIVHCTHAWIP